MKKEIQCRDCGATFVFTVRQQRHYATEGWKEPIRCPECRIAKKAYYDDPSYGWESALYNYQPTKTRHHRVDYAPHLVYGFR